MLKLQRRARLRRDQAELASIRSMDEELEEESHRALDLLEAAEGVSFTIPPTTGALRIMGSWKRDRDVRQHGDSSSSSAASSSAGDDVAAAHGYAPRASTRPAKSRAWPSGFLLKRMPVPPAHSEAMMPGHADAA